MIMSYKLWLCCARLHFIEHSFFLQKSITTLFVILNYRIYFASHCYLWKRMHILHCHTSCTCLNRYVEQYLCKNRIKDLSMHINAFRSTTIVCQNHIIYWNRVTQGKYVTCNTEYIHYCSIYCSYAFVVNNNAYF